MAAQQRVTRREFLFVSGALGGVALLSACAPQAPASSGPTPVAPAQASGTRPPAAAQSTPGTTTPIKRGGSLVVALETDPVTLDPYKAANSTSINAFELAYESLTSFDQNLAVQPGLAEKWDAAPNGLEYTLMLRQGVKWHDGKDFTGADVKYWFEHLSDKATGSRWAIYFDAIDHVEIVDERTAKLVMKSASAGLLNYFATLRGGSITQDGSAEKSNLATFVTGTGPFKLVEFVAQDRVHLVRNPNYWMADLPYLDEVTMKVLPDVQTRVAALRTGQVHIAPLNKDAADQLQGVPNVQVVSAPEASLYYVLVNCSRKPLNDVRVRQALRMALDPNEMIQKAVSGAGRPGGPISPGFENWGLKESELSFQKPDLAKAKALLAEAGQPEFKLTLVTMADAADLIANATVAQAAWKQIGVTAEIQPLDSATFATRTQPPAYDYDMSFSGLGFQGDPDGYLYPYVHSKGNRNANGGYSNPKVDELLIQGRQTADPQQRHQIYHDVQLILQEELPLFWLFESQQFVGLRTNVKGFAPRFDARRTILANTWLDG
jgi:peptide/nickel transport system substrate-binding protein